MGGSREVIFLGTSNLKYDLDNIPPKHCLKPSAVQPEESGSRLQSGWENQFPADHPPQNALSLREIEVLKQASNSHTPTEILPKN